MMVSKDDILICRNSHKITILNKKDAGRRLIINDKAMFNKTDDELISIYFRTNIKEP